MGRIRPLLRADGEAAIWAVSRHLVDYPVALAAMEARAAAIAAGEAAEMVWLLEHPALYTAGVSARPSELLAPFRLPVFQSGRGGKWTWHGPDQRVCYVMLDLSKRGRDVRAFVAGLEAWLIDALSRLGVEARAIPGRIGVWVEASGSPDARGNAPAPGSLPRTGEEKIAAIGVRLRRWVSFHGVSLNVSPDLSHFEGIVPCGFQGLGVTSLEKLGVPASMAEVDAELMAAFFGVFGKIHSGEPPQSEPTPSQPTAISLELAPAHAI
ncbi:MAG: lipoyl(octanoyl) transferase LipB [Caulobacteraceae bacterium]